MFARTLSALKLSHDLDALVAVGATKKLPEGVSQNLLDDTRKRIEARANNRILAHTAAFGLSSTCDFVMAALDEKRDRAHANVLAAEKRRAAIEARALEAVEVALA